MILTDDDRLRYHASLFLDKCYQREEGIRNPFFLATNYQMTEMQGAVALAQLERLAEFTGRRRMLGTRLSEQLAEIDGITLQRIAPGSKHSYFLYLFKLDLEAFGLLGRGVCGRTAARGCKRQSPLTHRRAAGLFV